MTEVYDVTEMDLFNDFIEENDYAPTTERKYKNALGNYCNFHQMTLQELLDEAEEEELSQPILKKRKIKRRIISFRTYLLKEKKYASWTIKTNLVCVKAFYHYHDITIPKIKNINFKSSPNDAIGFKDLPDMDTIRTAIESTKKAKHKALFLFAACTGSARRELHTFKYKQFLEGVQPYCPTAKTPEDIIKLLDGKCEELDVIPVFKMKRIKSDTYYYTAITPECTQFCINYLKAEGLGLKDDDPFFQLSHWGVASAFALVNQKFNWGKRGTYDFFSSHRVRKFHASMIKDMDFGDFLQGRSTTKTREAYYKIDIDDVRERYREHMAKFSVYARYDIMINSEAVETLQRQLDIEKEQHAKDVDDLKQQLDEKDRKHGMEMDRLRASNLSITAEMADIRNQMDNIGIQNQMVELQKRAAQHPLAQETPGIMEYVMTIFKDKIDFNERSYYSDAEIDDMVRLALATKNKVESYEDVLTEEKLQEQYSEHYAEATEIINQYKERYVTGELGVPLSNLQNQNVDKALLPFKQQVLENKKNPDHVDGDIYVLIDPSEVENIIDEALGLVDSVEAIYGKGDGVNIVQKFK